MAFAPVVGAVAGAVGTVSAISSQSRQAREQARALEEQKLSQTKQFETLNIQRQFQKDMMIAEQGRYRQEVALAEQAKMFNLRLQELATNRAELVSEFQTTADLFAVQQQRMVEMAQAAQQVEQTSQQLGAATQQQKAQLQQRQQEDVAQVTAAAQGQTESLSTTARAQGASLQTSEAMSEFNQLFELQLSVAEQNRAAADRLAQLQEAVTTSEIRGRQMMANQDSALARTQLEAARENVLLESQMNNAALDAELSSRLFQLEAAQTNDQVAYSSSMRLNESSQRQVRASAPNLFSSLPGLVGAGMTLYNTFSPPTVSPRVTNPLAMSPKPVDYSGGVASNAQSRQASQGLDYRQGVITDRTNSLFNVG